MGYNNSCIFTIQKLIYTELLLTEGKFSDKIFL